MIRDYILYLLFKIGNIKYINSVFKLYYKLGISTVKFYVSRLNFIESMYLKGSFNEDYFIPVISDLDFYIIGKKTSANLNIIEKRFKYLSIIFPFISDFDFLTSRESDYLRNFSGLKFLTSYKWKCIKGESIGFSYRYYPRKFYIDIVHEIYFQMVWLNNNLKKRTINYPFKTLCIYRQYLKITDLLNFLDNHEGYEYSRLIFKENKEWKLKTNEEIVFLFDELISSNKKLSSIRELYKNELEGYIYLDEVLKEKYFVMQCEIISETFKFSDKLHFYSIEVFELFYYTGCIDSYMIINNSKCSNDLIGRLFSKAMYFSKLIEGRVNSIDGREKFINDIDEANSIKEQLLTIFPYVFRKTPISTFNKNISILHCSTKKNALLLKNKVLLNKTKQDELFVIVYLTHDLFTEFISEERIFLLPVHQPEYIQDINQTIALMKKGIDWSFLASTISISTSNSINEIDKEVVLGEVSSDKDMVVFTERVGKHIVKDNNMIWSTSYDKWLKFGEILFPVSYIYFDEILYYKIKGELLESFPKEYFVRKIKELYNYNKNLSIFNTKNISLLGSNDKAHYKYLDNFECRLLKYSRINDLGFYEINDDSLKSEYKFFKSNMGALSLYGFLQKYDEYYSNFGFEIDNLSTVNSDILSYQVKNEHSIGIKKTDKNVLVVVYKLRTVSNLNLQIIWDLENIMPGQYYIDFETNIDVIDRLEIRPLSSKSHLCETYTKVSKNILRVPVFLSEKDTIEVQIDCELLEEKEYYLNLVNINKINFSNISFEKFRNIPLGYNNSLFELGRLSHGIYKLTIILGDMEDVIGFLTCEFKIMWPVNYKGSSYTHEFYFETYQDELYQFRFLQDLKSLINIKVEKGTFKLFSQNKDFTVFYSLNNYDLLQRAVKSISSINNGVECEFYSGKSSAESLKIIQQLKLNVEKEGLYIIKWDAENAKRLSININVSGLDSHTCSQSYHISTSRVLSPIYLRCSDCIFASYEFTPSSELYSSIKLISVDFFEPSHVGDFFHEIAILRKNENLVFQNLDPGVYRLIINLDKPAEISGYFLNDKGICWPIEYKQESVKHIFTFCIFKFQELTTFETEYDILKFEKIQLTKEGLFEPEVKKNELLINNSVNNYKNIPIPLFNSFEEFEIPLENQDLNQGLYFLRLKLNMEKKFNNNYFFITISPSYVECFGCSRLFLPINKYIELPINLPQDSSRLQVKLGSIRNIINECSFDISFRRISFDYDSPFLYRKPVLETVNKIELGFLPTGSGYIQMKFKDEVELSSYFTTDEYVLWPIQYKEKSNTHNVYFEVDIGSSNIILRDLNPVFNLLETYNLHFTPTNLLINSKSVNTVLENGKVQYRTISTFTTNSMLEAGYYELYLKNYNGVTSLSVFSQKDFKRFEVRMMANDDNDFMVFVYLSESTNEFFIDQIQHGFNNKLLYPEQFKKINFYDYKFVKKFEFTKSDLNVRLDEFFIIGATAKGVYRVELLLSDAEAISVTVLDNFKEVFSTVYLAEEKKQVFFFKLFEDAAHLSFCIDDLNIDNIQELVLLSSDL